MKQSLLKQSVSICMLTLMVWNAHYVSAKSNSIFSNEKVNFEKSIIENGINNLAGLAMPTYCDDQIIYEEQFCYSNGTQYNSNWIIDISGITLGGADDYFAIYDNRWKGRDLDGIAYWKTKSVNIAGKSNVEVTLDIEGYGDMESTDYMKIYYSIDGGTWVLFETNGEKYDSFYPTTASHDGLSGNTIQVIVKMYNTAEDEKYYIDNVKITADGCCNVSYGGSIGNGQTNCMGFDPSEITCISGASGGYGTLEYIWLQSSVSTFATYTVIAGATGASYNPGYISATTYYVRGAKRSGACTEYIWSNVITMTVTNTCSPCAGVLYNETFEQADGTRYNSNWVIDVSGVTLTGADDYFGTYGHRYKGRDLDGYAYWKTTVVNIAGQGPVSASIDMEGYGAMEVDQDFIKVYYSLDGGTWTLFSTNGEKWGAFSTLTATKSGLTGSTLQIIVKMYNTAVDEKHYIDNVKITGSAVSVSTVSNNASCSAICNGSVDISISGGTSPYTYAWSNGATTQDLSGVCAGTYTLTLTDYNGCTATHSVTVIGSPSPVCSIDGPSEFCEGGSAVLSAPAGYTYLWSTGATTQTIEVTAGGVYSVTIKNGSGCSSTCEKEVIMNEKPDAYVDVDGDLTICEDGSVILTAQPSGLGITYEWGLVGSGIFAYTQSITVTEPGTYAVHLTSSEGCKTDPSGIITVVTEAENPVCSIDASGSTAICAGASVTLTASSAGSYAWSTGETTQSITVSAAAVYSVTVTNEEGCSSTCEIEVTLNDNPVCSIEGELDFCEGGSTTLTAPAGYNYSWSTGETTQSIVISTAGNYSVTISTDAGCSSTCSADVIENPKPDAYVDVDGSLSLCDGESVTLTAQPSGLGITYEWGLVGTGIFAYTQTVTVSEPGTYAVHLTSSQGCKTDPSGILTVVAVHDNPVCSITPDGPTTFCAGGSVTLTAATASSYLWSTGATTQSITVGDAGTYSVTITNEHGCSSTCEIEVSIESAPDGSITGTLSYCAGGSTMLTAMPAGMSYAWSNGATTQSITVSTPGTYSVTVTNASGCSDADNSVTVTEDAAPLASITPDGSLSICQGAYIYLNANTGTGLTYQWYKNGNPIAGQTSKKYKAKAAGTYTVKVTNAAGCSATSAGVIVSILPGPTVSFSTPNGLDLCAPGDVVLSTHGVAGTTFQWYKNNVAIAGATDAEYIATSTGTYYLIATNSEGCSKKSKVKTVISSCRMQSEGERSWMNIYPNPTEADVIITYDVAQDANVTIEVTDIQGRLISSEFISNANGSNSTTFNFSGLAKGIYYITLTSDTERIIKDIVVQ
ncbi:MAG: T9SS type A sorting domain-containing protein [Fimbriimonadaceae bacterium]|nr:T9SS type A sorting domain-containing protein [Chitinophagales bacterium]